MFRGRTPKELGIMLGLVLLGGITVFLVGALF